MLFPEILRVMGCLAGIGYWSGLDVRYRRDAVPRGMRMSEPDHQRKSTLIRFERDATNCNWDCQVGSRSELCLSRRRCTEEGIRMASRYFATVRRAISIPDSRKRSTIVSSESIADGSSASIICLIR